MFTVHLCHVALYCKQGLTLHILHVSSLTLLVYHFTPLHKNGDAQVLCMLLTQLTSTLGYLNRSFLNKRIMKLAFVPSVPLWQASWNLHPFLAVAA